MTRIKELFKELYGDEAEERTRAFIVDDEPAVAKGIGRTLRMSSAGAGIATTVEVTSPGDAIEDLKREAVRDFVALISTDFHIPGGMNGLQFAACVRRVIGETRIPILLCSGGITDADRGVVDEAIRSGIVDAFLKKPFEPEEMFAAVESAIDRRLELVKMSQGGGGQEGETVPGQADTTSAEQGGVAGSGQEGEAPQK